MYQSIISEMQSERVKMRSQQMLERINKLSKTEGAMNAFIAKQREKKELQLRISKEDQDKIEESVQYVDSLKSKVKKEMAQARVLDLTSIRNEIISIKKKETEDKKEEPTFDTGAEKINY